MADETKQTTTSGVVLSAPIKGVTMSRAIPSDEDVGFKKRTYFMPEYFEVNVPYSVQDKGERYESTHRAILWEDREGTLYAIGNAPANVNRPNELQEYQYIAKQNDDGEFEYEALDRANFKKPRNLDLVVIWNCQDGVDGSRPRIDNEYWRALEGRGGLYFDPAQLNDEGEDVRYPDGTVVFDAETAYVEALRKARTYLRYWNNDVVRALAVGNLTGKPRIVKRRQTFATKQAPRPLGNRNTRPKAEAKPTPKANKSEQASSQLDGETSNENQEVGGESNVSN